MRAQGPDILEAEHANISCAPSYMSVYAHFLLLVQEVIIFVSNALGVQSDPPTPPSIYFCRNRADFLSPICIYVIYDTTEQMSGGIIRILNRPSPPHLPYPAYPSFL